MDANQWTAKLGSTSDVEQPLNSWSGGATARKQEEGDKIKVQANGEFINGICSPYRVPISLFAWKAVSRFF